MENKIKYSDKVVIRGMMMQIDYWIIRNNQWLLLVERFQRHICEETLEFEKYLDAYTEQQKLNWRNSKKIVVYENEIQLRKFIEDAKKRKNAGKKLYFGKIKDVVAKRIMDVTSYNVEGYNCALYSDSIRKIHKDHGDEQNESLRGQRAIKDADFFRIPKVIGEPEVIEFAGMYNKNPVVRFKKNGITIVGIIADGSLDLYTQTMYINKKIEALQQR